MNQLTGNIDTANPQTGLKPLLRLNISLDNKDNSSFDLVSVTCHAYISFSERGQVFHEFANNYAGDASLEGGSRTITLGATGYLTLVLPVDFDLLADIEDRRNSRDVEIILSLSFAGITRKQDGTIGSNVIAGQVGSERNPGGMQISKTVARSDWEDFLRQWQYSDIRSRIKEISRLSEEAHKAKREAEEAATAAKQASGLTAVVGLSDAYSQEARALAKSSRYWLVVSLIVAVVGLATMLLYAKESLNDKFTLPEALIRAVVLAAIFGGFTLCLRIYEAYQHLEVVNRHRVNIGRTFEAFKAAQPTDRAKEIMAAITAENMLAFGKSGFAGKDSPNQGPLAGATELIKAILEKQAN